MRLKYAPANIVEAARSALRRNDLSTAKRLIQSFRGENGTTPEALEALSWFPRGLFTAPASRGVGVCSRGARLAVRHLKRSEPGIRSPHLCGGAGGSIQSWHKEWPE